MHSFEPFIKKEYTRMASFINADLFHAVSCNTAVNSTLAASLGCAANSISWFDDRCTPDGTYAYTTVSTAFNQAGCCACSYMTPKSPPTNYFDRTSLTGFYQAYSVAVAGVTSIWLLVIMAIAALQFLSRQRTGPQAHQFHKENASRAALKFRSGKYTQALWTFLLASFVTMCFVFCIWFVIINDFVLNGFAYKKYYARLSSTVAIILHALGGSIWLMLGSLQLIPALRQAKPQFHMRNGYAAIGGAVMCDMGGYLLALGPHHSGFAGSFEFFTFSTWMITCVVLGMFHGRRGRIMDHQIWMTRAVLFAFAVAVLSRMSDVIFSFTVPLFAGGHTGLEDAFIFSSCWAILLTEAILFLSHRVGLYAMVWPGSTMPAMAWMPTFFKRCPFSGALSPAQRQKSLAKQMLVEAKPTSLVTDMVQDSANSNSAITTATADFSVPDSPALPAPGSGQLLLTSLQPCLELRLKARRSAGPGVEMLYLSLPSPDMVVALPIGTDVQLWAPRSWLTAMTARGSKSADVENPVVPADALDINQASWWRHDPWVIRTYSPMVLPSVVAAEDPLYTQDTLLLLVKRVPGGIMSNALHNMQPGDVIWSQGPSGSFKYTPGCFRKVGLVAAGSGLSGVMQVLTAELDTRGIECAVTLMILARKEEDVLMQEKLRAISAAHSWRLRVVVMLSGGVRPAGAAAGVEGSDEERARSVSDWAEVRPGRINAEVMREVFGTGSEDAFLGVCGPVGVNALVTGIASRDLGYQPGFVWGFGTSDR